MRKSDKKTVTFKEMPSEIQGKILADMILLGVIILASVGFAISSKSLVVLGYGMLVAAIFFGYIAYFYLQFRNDNVLYIEGTTVEVPEGIGKRGLVRRTFELKAESGELYQIVKQGNKIKRKGSEIRVFVLPQNILQKDDGRIFINQTLFINVLKY